MKSRRISAYGEMFLITTNYFKFLFLFFLEYSRWSTCKLYLLALKTKVTMNHQQRPINEESL